MNTSINGFFPRVSLAFARKIDFSLIAFVRNVVDLLGGLSTKYPMPIPPLATVTASVDSFETKVHEALNGGKIEIGARNAARIELLALMRQLAAFVQCHCDSVVQNIVETGFQAVRAPSPVGTLPAPGNLRLVYTGMSGELLLKFDRVANANNYSIESAESPNGPWNDEGLSTKIQATIDGLTPGKTYWARACANGSKGSSEFGGPATAMAV